MNSDIVAVEVASGADLIYLLLQICHVETQEYRNDVWRFGEDLAQQATGAIAYIQRAEIDRLFGTHGLRPDLATSLIRAFALARGCDVLDDWPTANGDVIRFRKTTSGAAAGVDKPDLDHKGETLGNI